MSYFGTADYEGCIDDAVNAFTNKVFWVGLGRTTEWDNPLVPPATDRAATAIDEPIVYAIPDEIHLCTPVAADGDVTLGTQQYAFVDAANAFTQFARFIYLKAVFNCELNPALPYADWRQCGVFSDLVPVSGHENDQWLAPVNVQENGRLRVHMNMVKRVYGPGSPTTVECVLEYR